MLFPVIKLGKIIRLSAHSFNSSCKKTKVEIADFKIDNSNFQKFSGSHFDNRLIFDCHIQELRKHWLTY